MNLQETIEQLEELLDHCKDMARAKIDEKEDPWERDVKALNAALKILKMINGEKI